MHVATRHAQAAQTSRAAGCLALRDLALRDLAFLTWAGAAGAAEGAAALALPAGAASAAGSVSGKDRKRLRTLGSEASRAALGGVARRSGGGRSGRGGSVGRTVGGGAGTGSDARDGRVDPAASASPALEGALGSSRVLDEKALVNDAAAESAEPMRARRTRSW